MCKKNRKTIHFLLKRMKNSLINFNYLEYQSNKRKKVKMLIFKTLILSLRNTILANSFQNNKCWNSSKNFLKRIPSLQTNKTLKYKYKKAYMYQLLRFSTASITFSSLKKIYSFPQVENALPNSSNLKMLFKVRLTIVIS